MALPRSSPQAGQEFSDKLLRETGFDQTALQGLQVVHVASGRVVCHFKAGPAVLNRYGTLHGGCIATLVDTISTAALVTTSAASGVSLNISVSYMAPVPGGADPVVIDARVVKAGRTIATLEVDISVDGRLCARGTHIKHLSPPASMVGQSQSKL